MKRLLLVVLVASCGGDDSQAQADAAIDGSGSGSADAAIDAPPSGGALTLTSPVLTEGGVIMTVNACAGANTSPQLAWTGNAMNAMSFAVVLTDKSNNLVHWVIYDIPGTATGLPANVEKVYAPTNVAGAHQTLSYQNVRGYLGPCPGTTHTYEFAVYALSVATLPGASMTTTRAQAMPLIMQNMVASDTLTGTYTP
jgi:Raf kinase inhibitor-like YbhB/YbcL family protein